MYPAYDFCTPFFWSARAFFSPSEAFSGFFSLVQKNVPRHILAPSAVACDNLHLRASVHLRHTVPFFNRKFHRNFLFKKSGTSSRKCRTLFFRQLIFRFTAKLYRISFIRFVSSLLVNLRLLCFAVLEEVFRYSREQSVG